MGSVLLTIRVPEELKDVVMKAASEKNVSTGEYVRRCIERYMVPEEKPKKVKGEYDYKALGVDAFLEVMERKGFDIHQTMENLRWSAEYSPKFTNYGTGWRA